MTMEFSLGVGYREGGGFGGGRLDRGGRFLPLKVSSGEEGPGQVPHGTASHYHLSLRTDRLDNG